VHPDSVDTVSSRSDFAQNTPAVNSLAGLKYCFVPTLPLPRPRGQAGRHQASATRTGNSKVVIVLPK